MNSERILYLECSAGISGDMTVAALLDLGADEERLRAALCSLPLEGYELRISRVKKSGLDACDFAVVLDEEYENHDHDMDYLHRDMHMHNHAHDARHHSHHAHEMADIHHSHTHRGLPEIRRIVEAGALTAGAKELALHIFDILADAEAKAHGVPRDQVHFHEVGAVDSIADIVAAAVCIDELAPQRIVISELAEGTGTVRCQHGILPIPVPAVANIAAAYGLPIHRTGVAGELVTPTGAAIAAAFMQTHNELPQDYVIEKIGIGAGKRAYETAGILRAMWIRPIEKRQGAVDGQFVSDIGTIVKLEANIDDATGEELGYCMERLMEAGARDVSFVPLYMKKNRPAYEVHVICDPQDVLRMEEILFRETTTIGIRRVEMERSVMERTLKNVETPYGTAQVKICRFGSICKAYPEYGSVVELCKKTKQDFRKVYQTILDLTDAKR